MSITSSNLTVASQLLFGDPSKLSPDLAKLRSEGPLVQSSLEILNRSIQAGCNTVDLSLRWDRHRIMQLNKQLASNQLGALLKEKWNLSESEIGNLSGIQLQLPPSFSEKVVGYFSTIPRIIFAVWGVLHELGSTALAAGLNVFAHVSFDSVGTVKNQIPVILVHGLSSNQSIWRLFRRELNKRGHESIHALNLDESIIFSRHNVEEYSRRLQAKIEDVCAKTGQDRVILICHSLGGVVGAKAAQNGKIKAVITLGSPLKGTSLVNILEKYVEPVTKKIGILIPAVARQLKSGSPTLNEIRENAQVLDETGLCRFYHVRAKQDVIVIGDEVEFIHQDTKRQLTLPYAGHVGMVFARDTINAVDRWLREIPLIT